MSDLDVYGKLPEFSWREKEYPILDSEYSFRHDDAQHKLSFGNVTLVQPLGPQNPTFRYTLSMRQGISRGPYKNLFSQIPTLEQDCYDRTPGPLVDPIYGNWTVKPVDYRSRASGKDGRDGIDVEVSFVWTPTLDDDVRGVAAPSVEDLRDEGGKLDAEVEKIARKYDEPPPGPTINALDAPAAILGQIDRQAEKTQAQLSAFANSVEKTERFLRKIIKRTRDPDAFGAHRTARRIRASTERSKREVEDLTSNIISITVEQSKTLIATAAELGMTVKQFLSLNPSLAATPMLPQGIIVNKYA
jgi:hypothetical protein